MPNINIKIKGIDLGVEYSRFIENDPLGTGDSPRTCVVDIIQVVAVSDILILLERGEAVIEQIEDVIIKIELEG